MLISGLFVANHYKINRSRVVITYTLTCLELQFPSFKELSVGEQKTTRSTALTLATILEESMYLVADDILQLVSVINNQDSEEDLEI